MSPAIVVFFSSFVFIALKAFQQLNVVHDKYWFIMPTSFAMAGCEIIVISTVAHGFSFPVWFSLGTGAGLGCICSMFVHKRVR